MRNERLSRFPVILFSFGVLFNCLFFTSIVLDYTLVPRFVFLSIFILVFFIIVFVFFKDFKLSIDFFSLPYLLFVFFSIASVIWSINISLSIVETAKIILYFCVFIASYTLLLYYDTFFIKVFFKTIILLFFISTIPFFFQLSELSEMTRGNLYQLTGISGHKNLYSSFIFLCLICSLISFTYLKQYWKFIVSSAIAIQLLIIILLQTRAVWLGCIVFVFSGGVAYFLRNIFKPKGNRSFYVFVVISLLIINLFFIYALPSLINIYVKNKPVSDNVEKISDLTTLSERALVWQKTYEVFQEHPVLGVGANNWQIHFPRLNLPDIYPVQKLNVTFQRPHNDFVWILSEYGIIGFNLYMIFILTILFFLFYKITNRFSISYLILFSGIIAFLAISFFDFPKERIEHNILFYLILSISLYLSRKDNQLFSMKQITFPKSVHYGVLLLIMVLIYFSFLNFKGEYLTKKMYVERLKRNNSNVIYLCNSALSICYSLDPTTVPVLWYKGNANANLGNYANALIDFKSALKAHPFNPHVLNDLGSAFFMVNKIDSAKYYYKKASVINPRFDDPKLNLTVIYINEGNYREAKRWNESLLHDSDKRDNYRGIINEALE